MPERWGGVCEDIGSGLESGLTRMLACSAGIWLQQAYRRHTRGGGSGLLLLKYGDAHADHRLQGLPGVACVNKYIYTMNSVTVQQNFNTNCTTTSSLRKPLHDDPPPRLPASRLLLKPSRGLCSGTAGSRRRPGVDDQLTLPPSCCWDAGASSAPVQLN